MRGITVDPLNPGHVQTMPRSVSFTHQHHLPHSITITTPPTKNCIHRLCTIYPNYQENHTLPIIHLRKECSQSHQTTLQWLPLDRAPPQNKQHCPQTSTLPVKSTITTNIIPPHLPMPQPTITPANTLDPGYLLYNNTHYFFIRDIIYLFIDPLNPTYITFYPVLLP